MIKIGLFYGSTSGKTAEIAKRLQVALGGETVVDCHDIADVSLDQLLNYEVLLLGSPTWNIGDLQSDWEAVFDDLDHLDFSGKVVAYFGTGDQVGYRDNFIDAIGILEKKISRLGGKTVGYWPTTGYDFTHSQARRGEQFCGLALDEDNQPDKTDDRIQAWVAQLQPVIGL